MKKLTDQYTDLLVSRQRKWSLRHPEQQKEYLDKYVHSEAGRLMSRHKYHKRVGKIFKNCPKCKKSTNEK